MKNISLKYGIVISIFMTVIYTIFCAFAPKLMTGFLPWSLLLGVTLALMLFYNITYKKENEGPILYHEAFIATFIMGAVAIGLSETSKIILKRAIFSNVSVMEKEILVKLWQDFVEKSKLEKTPDNKPKYNAEELNQHQKYLTEAEKVEYKPLKTPLNTFLLLVLKTGFISLLLSLFAAIFGFKRAESHD